MKIYEFFSQLKNKLVVLFNAIGYSLKCFFLSAKGQLPKYEILQLSHRLEKGLLNKSPKPFWGWEKAERIASLIVDNKDDFSTRTGKGVLKAYIDAKKASDNLSEREKATRFEKDYYGILTENTPGGIISLTRSDIQIENKQTIEQFISSRHSCRDYQNKLVSREDIEAAIALALKCPSACNRQVTKCYVYQSKDLQTIILTTSIRAYDVGEFNDWFISPSIFAGYLSLSLHLYGIGSCVYRKQLYGKHAYNVKMRDKFGIPNDEMIILEIRFGYYKDSFSVAMSNRHDVNDIVSYVEE